MLDLYEVPEVICRERGFFAGHSSQRRLSTLANPTVGAVGDDRHPALLVNPRPGHSVRVTGRNEMRSGRGARVRCVSRAGWADGRMLACLSAHYLTWHVLGPASPYTRKKRVEAWFADENGLGIACRHFVLRMAGRAKRCVRAHCAYVMSRAPRFGDKKCEGGGYGDPSVRRSRKRAVTTRNEV